MLPATSDRVERNTAAEINQARQQEIDESLRYHRRFPGEIPTRLAELDREWDIERALQANAAAVSLAGLALSAFIDKRFVAIPFGVAGFLMQHAIQGWCPPMPVLRRLGFRTPAEICEERCRLSMLSRDARAFSEPTIAVTRTPARVAARWTAVAEEIHEGVEA